MLKKDVKIGAKYVAKVNGYEQVITLVGLAPYGDGWVARNDKTGREIRIKSAAKLRGEVIDGKFERYTPKSK